MKLAVLDKNALRRFEKNSSKNDWQELIPGHGAFANHRIRKGKNLPDFFWWVGELIHDFNLYHSVNWPIPKGFS